MISAANIERGIKFRDVNARFFFFHRDCIFDMKILDIYFKRVIYTFRGNVSEKRVGGRGGQ